MARSLGLGRLRTFWRVTVGQARLAILGGSVLVALVVLAEFGAFEILGFRTLTTEIYTEFSVGFNDPGGLRLLPDPGGARAASSSSGEGSLRGRPGRPPRRGGGPRQLRPVPLGRARWPCWAGWRSWWAWRSGCRWGRSSTYGERAAHRRCPRPRCSAPPATPSSTPAGAGAAGHGGRPAHRPALRPLPAPGGAPARAVQHADPGRARAGHRPDLHLLDRALLAGLPLPDRRCSRRDLRRHVLPPGGGLGPGRGGPLTGRARRGRAFAGRAAGARCFWRVTLPLIGPGLAAAFCLVFLESATELTATLVLHPTNAQTLATQFWAFQTDLSYSQAAPYAGRDHADRRRAELRPGALVRPPARAPCGRWPRRRGARHRAQWCRL